MCFCTLSLKPRELGLGFFRVPNVSVKYFREKLKICLGCSC